MSIQATVIDIFPPNSRKARTNIRSLIPTQAFAALATRVGEDMAKKAEKAHKTLLAVDGDFIQLNAEDGGRIRIKLD